MAKTLVIVESPTKAKTIGKFLGRNYVVKASMGHIRDLPEKSLGVDVEKNYEPDYVVSRDKNKTVKELKEAMKGVDKVLLATDEDREGEAIAWHLLHALKIKLPYERIVFHEITKDAILRAVSHPRDVMLNLVDAQQARRVLDRLVGYKLSPFLWKKVRKGLSAGRVQSVAVRLIVEKEREITAFKQEEYWHILAHLNTPKKEKFVAKLEQINKKKAHIPDEKAAKAVEKDLAGEEIYTTLDVTKKENKRTAPAPFTTSTLQQEASRKHGYGVKNTMRIAQQLYEGIDTGSGSQGLITYMRTDSVNLSQTALDQAKQVITEKFGKEYALSTPRKYKTKAKGAQEAHEAIRPTDLSLSPEMVKEYLSKEQYNLYRLIWNRTIATQMKEALVEITTAKLSPKNKPEYVFVAKGNVITFPGYMQVYIEGKDTDDEEEGMLPALAKDDACPLQKLDKTQHFTKPPARYTEATLVKKLESEGIGRPSTYAPTISTIIDKGYIEKKEKHLYPTEIAFVVNDLLVAHFPNEVDYSFTAKMEEDFDQIAEGTSKWQAIVDNFYKPFEAQLAKKSVEVEKVQEKTGEMCDKCGQGEMLIKFGRFGKFQACSNYPECKNVKPMKDEEERREALEKEYADKKCETCGSGLIVKKGRFGEFLACSNYPECKFTAPIVKSTGVQCPDCKKGELVERKSKRGKLFYSCSTYPDCKKAVWNKPYEKPCVECKGLALWSRKGIVKCESCGHEESIEQE